MPSPPRDVDALVVGGGFFGARIAVALSRRVHGGYHYPRSILTSLRSRANYPRFIQDYPGAVDRAFTKLYAIARHNSKVSASQFAEFCRRIGAPALVAVGVSTPAVEPGGARGVQPDVKTWTR